MSEQRQDKDSSRVTAFSVNRIAGRNAFWNLLRYLVNFSVVFVLTPIVIEAVGDARYGLWALVFSIIGYAGLVDLGVEQAVVKLVSQHRGRGDAGRLNAVASTALAFFLLLAALVALVCWFVLPGYMHLFIADAEVVKDAGSLLGVIGAGMFFLFAGNVVSGIALGLHQFHFKGMFDSVAGILRLGLTILVLRQGMGLVGLAWVKVGIDILSLSFMSWACFRGFPGLRLSPGLVGWTHFKELVGFGSKLFTSQTMIRLNRSTNPVIIAYFLSTIHTAYYSVAMRLVSYANEVLISVTAAFMPIFSELGAREGSDGVRDVYLRYSRYLTGVTVPAYLGVILFGPHFVGLWISPEYAAECGLALQLMATGALVRGLQPLHARVMVGWGKVGFYTRFVSLCMGLAIVLGAGLVPVVGIAGPPLAGLAMSLFQQGVFLVHLSRDLKFSRLHFVATCHVRLVPPALGFAAMAVWLLGPVGESGYLDLLAAAVASSAVYGTLALVIVLTAAERRAVLSGLPFVHPGPVPPPSGPVPEPTDPS